MTEPTAPVPAGWYPDPTGAIRWWDGAAWGPAAPPSSWGPPQRVEDAGKALSVLSWLGFFFAAIIVPLIVYLLEKDKNRFARWHAAEALNFQLTFLIIWMGSFLPLWFGMFAGAVAGFDPPGWLFALFPLLFVVYFAAMGVCIFGAVQAGRGVWWRCPVAIPFVREHRRLGAG